VDDAMLEACCLAHQGAVSEYKQEWQAKRYMVGDKMFALLGGDKTGKPLITLKLDPFEGELLRRQYQDIVPGYYMNKLHWNSVYLQGAVPDEVLRGMISKSYRIVFGSLSKRAREEALRLQ